MESIYIIIYIDRKYTTCEQCENELNLCVSLPKRCIEINTSRPLSSFFFFDFEVPLVVFN